MDVADDVSELASKIFPPISEKKLQASLKFMQKMNLVRKNESGFWKPTKDSLATVQQSKSQMVLQFQKQVETAAEKFKAQIRHIVTTDSEKPEIVEHINLHVFSNIRENNESTVVKRTAKSFEKGLV